MALAGHPDVNVIFGYNDDMALGDGRDGRSVARRRADVAATLSGMNRSGRGWTPAQLRHTARVLRYGRQPAATVYESLGTDVFGAFEPGWLNLGYWHGPGDEAEARFAPGRLVEVVCAGLPAGGTVLDVGNGLGAQDPVIAQLLRPDCLVAVNVSHFQLRAGRPALTAAGAAPVCADAVRLPIASGRVDTLVSVEAAFHFASRAGFFAEAARVLRPGGRFAASDIVVQRAPRGPAEVLAGLWTMRFWGLRRSAVQTADEIASLLAAAGLGDVQVHRCGAAVIDPALRVIGSRFRATRDRPLLQRWGARAMVAQWRFLRSRGLLDYVLVRAVNNDRPTSADAPDPAGQVQQLRDGRQHPAPSRPMRHGTTPLGWLVRRVRRGGRGRTRPG